MKICMLTGLLIVTSGCSPDVAWGQSEPAISRFATYLQTSRGLVDTGNTKYTSGEVEPALTARSRLRLTESRMRRWEKQLNAVITMNPRVVTIANSLDAEYASGDSRGPLHGYPVMLKDNIETLDMPTTAGSLALKDNHTGRDAEVV